MTVRLSLSTYTLTEVGRALNELGVTLILANSPQAKGRIERLWGTFQDRLVSELRLARAKTPEQAQAVLDRYLPEHNRKFSRATQAKPAWRKTTNEQIERALCFKEKRTVANDNTITFDGVIFQIPKYSPPRSYAHKRIDVHVALDGAVAFFYKHHKIAAFSATTTHALGLYRTDKKREGFRYGPISNQLTQNLQPSP